MLNDTVPAAVVVVREGGERESPGYLTTSHWCRVGKVMTSFKSRRMLVVLDGCGWHSHHSQQVIG
jgi:hypothetical protein